MPAAVNGLVALHAACVGVAAGSARLAPRSGVAKAAAAAATDAVALPAPRAAVSVRGAAVQRGIVSAPLAGPAGEAGAGAVGPAAPVAGAVGDGVALRPAVWAEMALVAAPSGS